MYRHDQLVLIEVAKLLASFNLSISVCVESRSVKIIEDDEELLKFEIPVSGQLHVTSDSLRQVLSHKLGQEIPVDPLYCIISEQS